MRVIGALILTVLITVVGIVILSEIAQMREGQVLLSALNWFAFILGFVYMILGARRGHIVRMGFGFALVCSAVAKPVFPEPLGSGFQLFVALGGLFIPAPRG